MNRPNWSKILHIALLFAPIVALAAAPAPWNDILFYGLWAAFFVWAILSSKKWPDDLTKIRRAPEWARAMGGVVMLLLIAMLTARDAHRLTRPFADLVAATGVIAAITAFFYIWEPTLPQRKKKETNQ